MALGIGTVAATAKVVLSVDDKGLHSGLASADRRFKHSVDEMDRHARRAHSSFGLLASGAKVAFGAVAAGAAGAAFALEKSVHAALEAQVSQTRLEQAFKATHVSMRAYADQIDKAEASSRKLGFTDTDTRNAIGSLMIATQDYTKAQKDLGVAQDIAAVDHSEFYATYAGLGTLRYSYGWTLLTSEVATHIGTDGTALVGSFYTGTWRFDSSWYLMGSGTADNIA